jgi:hypothetical protein
MLPARATADLAMQVGRHLIAVQQQIDRELEGELSI